MLERQQESVMLRASSQLLNNVEHWQAQAEEACSHAEQFDGPEVKRMMLEIAESYDKLAKHAAERRSSGREDRAPACPYHPPLIRTFRIFKCPVCTVIVAVAQS
jgi:hypothetical protein